MEIVGQFQIIRSKTKYTEEENKQICNPFHTEFHTFFLEEIRKTSTELAFPMFSHIYP